MDDDKLKTIICIVGIICIAYITTSKSVTGIKYDSNQKIHVVDEIKSMVKKECLI